MNSLNKILEKIARFFTYIISNNYKLNHKYQNKNQITNAEVVLNLLKNKNFTPKIIVDIGCGYGEWTKKLLKYYPNAEYFLFDADTNNSEQLSYLKKNIVIKL